MVNSHQKMALPTPAKLDKRLANVAPSASEFDPWGDAEKSIAFSSAAMANAPELAWPGDNLPPQEGVANYTGEFSCRIDGLVSTQRYSPD